MEFQVNGAKPVQKLNTKGCCFLCLETEAIHKKGNNGVEAWQTVSIRVLLQHLQITLNDHLLKENDNVDLCETCENNCKGFIKGLEEHQKAQMKMNYFLERISKTISGSKKDLKRVQVYSRRMTGDPTSLAQLAYVDGLRKKLEVKSLAMQVGPIPCIKLERTEVTEKNIQVKEEDYCAKDFSEFAEAIDGFDTCDSEPAEFPEHVTPSSEPLPSEPIKQEEEASPPKVETSKPCKNSQSFRFIKIKETGMYRCRKCDKTSPFSSTITRHYESVHLKIKYKCNICNLSKYSKLADLKTHQKTCRETLEERLAKEQERKGFTFPCDLCMKRFRSKRMLRNHKQVVHKNINRYACNLCDKKYTTLQNLNGHKNAIHFGEVFSCRFCKKQIRRKPHLFNHEKICHQRKTIKVESLPRPANQEEVKSRPKTETKASKSRKYSGSLYYIHVKESGMYQCKNCDRTSRSRYTIFSHYKNVHLQKRFKCDICNNATYVNSFNLKVHQKTCGETLERLAKERVRKELEYVCDLCGKQFEDEKGFNDHRKVFHKNNPYACNLCDKKYTKMYSLKQHKNAIHFGKVFYCRFCKQVIRYKTHLPHHEKVCGQRGKVKVESEEKPLLGND